MSNRFQRLFTALLGFTLLAGSALPLAASAAGSPGSNNGMKVSPVRTDLTINPGGSKTVAIELQNVTSSDGTYKVVTNDFEAKDETGAPGLLLDGSVNARHGLKTYLTTPKTVAVAKGQQKEVTVTVNIPKNAAGGGYYGAVRFVPVSNGSDNSNVSLSGSVASLILVSVPGDVTENLQIASFSASRGGHDKSFFTSSKDIAASVRFRNSGNVQEQPFGKILLKKGDKTVSSYEINNSDPRGNVLPDSIRRFDIGLKGIGSFGKYTLEGNFGYGVKGQLLSGSTSFYVVPLALIILVLVVIALIIAALLAVPKLLKRHDQRVLRRNR